MTKKFKPTGIVDGVLAKYIGKTITPSLVRRVKKEVKEASEKMLYDVFSPPKVI